MDLIESANVPISCLVTDLKELIINPSLMLSIRYNPAAFELPKHEENILSANKARAYFGIVGYHFNPENVTQQLGLEPTSTNNAGMRGSLDKPVISSWEFSTPTLSSDAEEIDIYKLLDDEILKKIEPVKQKIIDICKSQNLSPRIGIVLTLSIDKNESTPDVGFGARIIKFCAEIGAFIDVDYKLSERI